MKTCCCSLPYLDPSACENCTYNSADGRMFLPFDPERHSFEVHEGRYVIILKDSK